MVFTFIYLCTDRAAKIGSCYCRKPINQNPYQITLNPRLQIYRSNYMLLQYRTVTLNVICKIVAKSNLSYKICATDLTAF